MENGPGNREMTGVNITTAGIPKKGLPEGFVYLDEWIEDAVIDIRYAGTENFMGRPADGYFRPLAIISKEAAACCVKAADALRRQGYLLHVFDAYRPQRAVDDFVRWGLDIADQRRKPLQYPNIPKEDMFRLDYVSARSLHSRGSAIDLTIMDSWTHQDLDMGTIFDFMDVRSHPGAAGLTALQEENRLILCDAMLSNGFLPDAMEWWHYELADEPYPDTYFDFPVE